jgi:hypothetical protein
MREYWQTSRTHRYSLLFALPLLVLYETLAALLSDPRGGGVRNGADVLLKSFFIMIAGSFGPALMGLLLIGLSLWLIRRDTRSAHMPFRRWTFAGMAVESLLLAMVFGVVVGAVTAEVLSPFAVQRGLMANAGWPTQLMVSLGAGLYEELLFRVIVVGALAFVARRFLRWSPMAAGIAAAATGALLFSAFHYIGPYGDTFSADTFVFRAVGGLAFSGLFLWRGFGITAWTHALYDLMFLLS